MDGRKNCLNNEEISCDVSQYFRYLENDTIFTGIKKNEKYYQISTESSLDDFYSNVFELQNFDLLKEIYNFKTLSLLPPVPEVGHLIAAGLNYKGHNEETFLNQTIFFPKYCSLTGQNTDLKILKTPMGQLDYEIEFALLLKDQLDTNNIDLLDNENAADYIAGVFLVLDMTSREYMVRSSQILNKFFGFSVAKSFTGFAPTGHFFIKWNDFVKNSETFFMELSLNGKVKQNNLNDVMINSPLDLLKSYFKRSNIKRTFLSHDQKHKESLPKVLIKGSILLTGTPRGVLFQAPCKKTILKSFLRGPYYKKYLVKENHKFLHAGDHIIARSSYLGQIDLSIL